MRLGGGITESSTTRLACPSAASEINALVAADALHRTSNAFQLVAGLLADAARRTDDPPPALREAQERIAALSEIHRLLIPFGAPAATADVSEELNALAAGLQLAFSGMPPLAMRFDVRVECEPGLRWPRTATVLACMIVNELATNAVKHAFRDRSRGSVRIALQVDPARGDAELRVEDDGTGHRRAAGAGGAGLKLVEAQARMLGGSVVAASRPCGQARGTAVGVRLPLPDLDASPISPPNIWTEPERATP